MLPWRMAIVGLFYCCIKTGVTRCRTKAMLTAWLDGWQSRSVSWWVHHFGPDRNISTTIGWIAMTFCTDIHVPQRIKPSDIGDPLAFPLGPPAVLFPAANRIKRGVANVVNPTFHNSFDDVHLLFEILLAGIHFEASGEFSVQDAELASLRKTRNLEVICEKIIPRKLPDIFRLISDLSNYIGHLHQDDFERTLLTLVYTAQQMFNSTNEHQRDVWAESFVSLYKAIKQDLTETM